MSYYTKQNRSDEKASVIINECLVYKYGDYFDFQPHGSKDNTPDTDGILRLRRPYEPIDKNVVGEYETPTFLYQQKGVSNSNLSKKQTYRATRKTVEYLVRTNLPTILIVVDLYNNANIIYWKYFDDLTIKRLREGLSSKSKKDSLKDSFEIKYLNVIDKRASEEKKNVMEMHRELLSKGNPNILAGVTNEMREVMSDYKKQLSLIATMFYLSRRGLHEDSYAQQVSRIVGVGQGEIQSCVDHLLKAGVLVKVADLIALKYNDRTDKDYHRTGSSFLRNCFDDIYDKKVEIVGILEIAESQLNECLSEIEDRRNEVESEDVIKAIKRLI